MASLMESIMEVTTGKSIAKPKRDKSMDDELNKNFNKKGEPKTEDTEDKDDSDKDDSDDSVKKVKEGFDRAKKALALIKKKGLQIEKEVDETLTQEDDTFDQDIVNEMRRRSGTKLPAADNKHPMNQMHATSKAGSKKKDAVGAELSSRGQGMSPKDWAAATGGKKKIREEGELLELSKSTLSRYKQKATREAGDAEQDKDQATMVKRGTGIMKADKKLREDLNLYLSELSEDEMLQAIALLDESGLCDKPAFRATETGKKLCKDHKPSTKPSKPGSQIYNTQNKGIANAARKVGLRTEEVDTANTKQPLFTSIAEALTQVKD